MVLNRCLQFDSNYHKIAAQIFDEFLDDCENDSNMIPDRSLCRLGIVAHSLSGTYSRVLEIYDELVMSPMDELNRASDEREETMYRHVLRASMEMYGARAMCERVSRLAYDMPSCLRISASLLVQHVGGRSSSCGSGTFGQIRSLSSVCSNRVMCGGRKFRDQCNLELGST